MVTRLGLQARIMGVIAAACAVVAGSTAVATAAPAQMAAHCYGGSCRGHDPGPTPCANDAVTIKAWDYTAESSASFRIEVRYSRSCNAAWGRLVVYSGYNVGFALSAWNPNTPSVGAVGHSGNTTWTAMIDGSPLDCAGSQFYVNGQWVRWSYVGCA